MEGTGITPVMDMNRGYGDGFGFGGSGLWLFAILALMWGGNGFFGGNNGNTNAIQADVNRGFDNQNLQAQRNGVDLVGMTSSTTITTATTEVRTLNISGIVRVFCNEDLVTLTLVNSGLAITTSNIEIDVEYLG